MTTPENTPVSLPNFTAISDYERWAATNWVHPHGSLGAQYHAREKLAEETKELVDALFQESKTDIIKEAGDVLWTACATASNADITITEGLTLAFPGYFSPNAPITIADIDALAATLFDGIGLHDVTDYLDEGETVLGKKAKQWFVLRDGVATSEKTFAEVWINLKRADAVEALTRTTLLISFIAQHYANEGLNAVLDANYQKIEGRLKAGVAVTKAPLR